VTNPVPAVGFALVPLDLANRDGKLDLVDCKTGSILLGNGDGTFTALPPIIGLEALPLVPVSAADLNNDGKPDLISMEYAGLVTRLGNGDGTFQAPSTGMATTATSASQSVNLTLIVQ
jgi:hypothetical protein